MLLWCQHRRGRHGRVRPWHKISGYDDNRAAAEAVVHACVAEDAEEVEVQLVGQQRQQPTQQRQFYGFTESSFTRGYVSALEVVTREPKFTHTCWYTLTLLTLDRMHASSSASHLHSFIEAGQDIFEIVLHIHLLSKTPIQMMLKHLKLWFIVIYSFYLL